MTVLQKSLKSSLIKQVHISILYQQIYKHDRDMYEDLLLNHFGVSSSKELDIDQLMELVKFLNKKSDSLKVMMRKSDATPSQIRFIKDRWQKVAREKSEDALRAFIKRITKKSYLHIDSICKKDAQKIIIALKNMEDS